MQNRWVRIGFCVLIAAAILLGSSIGGGAPTTFYIGGFRLTGASFVNVAAGNLSLGDTNIYTVPAGKRALLYNVIGVNQGATSITWFPEVKFGGVSPYVRFGTDSVLATPSAGTRGASFVLEPGDILAINTATTAGLNVWAEVLLYDSTVQMFTPRKLTGWVNGNNTIYTAPAGKTAGVLPVTLFGGGIANLFYVNQSGSSSTTSWFIVPNAGTPGVTNMISAVSQLTVNNALNATNSTFSLSAGDSIVLSTDQTTGSQFAWVTIAEF